MYQNVDVRDWDDVWYHEYGDVMENQQTKERYLILYDSL